MEGQAPDKTDNSAQTADSKYNFRVIEDNWRDKWFNNNLYKAVDFSPKPKKYILAELPYPSGRFLHVGHMMRYTVPEIYSRFLRMQGYNVLYPMGWDCFGLPAEVFAISENSTPQKILKEVIPYFKDSMKHMGYAIDWDREIDTTDPSYYKWTQWMFLKLFEMGLVKKKQMPAWWCKELGTLADEEVVKDENGNTVSERKGYSVKRIMMEQWVLDVPKYANRLLNDLKETDYTQSVKDAQGNWIGKSDGAIIKFFIEDQEIEVFSTRADTIAGVTFIAISPEHPLINQLKNKITNLDEVNEYIDKSRNMSDLEKLVKDKTGVQLKGIMAKNPFEENKQDIPVFVADYILMSYGTGAIMGVPAHDIRDYEFAKKYDLEVIKTYELSTPQDFPYEGEGIVVNPVSLSKTTTEEYRDTVINKLETENKGYKDSTYKVREQIFSRKRYWGEPVPLIYKKDGTIEKVKETNLPIVLPELKENLTQDNVSSVLEKDTEWKATKDSLGNTATRETETMPTWAGSNWYYVRYTDPHNDKEYADVDKMKYWLPVDKYFGDAGHTAAHLLYTRFWLKALYDGGHFPLNEPIKYRMSGGILLGPDGKKMSKSKGNVVNAEDALKNYGADVVRIYLASIGPYGDTYPWSNSGINGSYRLISTIYQMRENVVDKYSKDEYVETFRIYNRALKNITEMISDLKLNTAASQINILCNHLKKINSIPKEIWEGLIKIIAPFCPFVAEELWQEYKNQIGKTWKNEDSIHVQEWPKYDEKYLLSEPINLPVQVNGKLKAVLKDLKPNCNQNEIENRAKELIKKFIENKQYKVIYVPSKIINFVVY